MKIWVLSDLHHDVSSTDGLLSNPEADVVVLAGDIQNERLVRELQEAYDDVVYVAGNHEFYGYDVLDRITQLGKFGDTFFNNTAKVINGVRFLGTTLWTDFLLYGKDRHGLAMTYAQKCMNDYAKIRYGDASLTPVETFYAHIVSKNFLSQHLRNPFDGPTVVVTHHGPSIKSVHESYTGDLLNTAYVSNLEDLIYETRPVLWVHGHVHNSFDYKIGNTRVVCNPRGYGIENKNFDPNLIIEI